MADADEHVISHDVRDPTHPDRNLALELVRVTEAAALAAGRWVGRGEKESADGAAVDAMRLMLDTVPMDGIVVIGEGEKDEAPMLYNGEEIGDGSPPEVDIAVDPLEGTDADRPRDALRALGDRALGARHDVRPRARASTWRRSPPAREVADLLDLDDPLEDVIRKIAERKGGEPGDVTVIMLDRPRHEEAIAGAPRGRRAASASSPTATSRPRCSRSCRTPASTCSGASAARPRACSRPRRSSASAASILGRLWPRDDEERKAARGRRLRPRPGARRRRPGRRRTTSSSPPPGVTDGDLLRRRPLPRRRPRDHRVAGDALALGHRAPRAGDATTARSCARWSAGATAEPRAVQVAAPHGRSPGVVLLVAERVDHRAGEHRQAERVEPDQGDEDEADRPADPVQVGDVGEVEREDVVARRR